MAKRKSTAAAVAEIFSMPAPTSFSDRVDTWFTEFAHHTSRWAGSPWVFVLAVATIATWAITGPLFGFSDTWQLVINTGTTIITFLMVFLIQSSQNRDSEAIQIKLDELIRTIDGAHNALLDLEDLEEEELDDIRTEYQQLADKARAALSKKRRKR
jgi:low affinity Fe/Cu permease